ncbi:MAG: flavodoxin family protein [Clostridia bacterium]|nr:flavodoxin family protein [Clostridia bacterium]
MENKKVLIIDGSGRQNGYTKKQIEYFKSICGCENIVTYELFKEKFEFCNGCNYCEENGKCRHRDLDEFFKEFETADFIVFASPLYNGTFSAPLKALIDRFQFYYTYFYKNNKTQKIKKNRKAVLLVSSGRDGQKWLSIMEEQLKFACSILNIEFIGSALCNYTDTTSQIEKAKEEITKLVERIGDL